MEIDYKKEYEAMVQRARELHETGNELTKRQMEIVCHELRESEDERIRKAIIELLKEIGRDDTGISENVKCMIAYLEKQKPEDVSATTMAPSCWEVEQKEQKPEWSEEDERKRQACISTINEVIDYERERWEDYNPGKPYRPIMKYDEQIDWLKSLRPPQYCEDCKLKRSVENWKPSKEQMRVLSWAANGMVDNSIAAPEMRAVLRELYEQLKKLGVKEEPEYYQHFDPDC